MTDSAMAVPRAAAGCEGHWLSVGQNVLRNRGGMAGLIILGAMLAISIFSPLLATDQPIVCRHEGRWYFPAIVELFQSRGSDPHRVSETTSSHLPQFDAKTQLDPDAFAIWPLIPYHKHEQSTDLLQPPSRRHWLGTDELGRDVAARMIHGAAASVKVGFVSIGIAAVIGIVVGGLAGYCGGTVDILVSRIVEIVTCFPAFFLILAVMVWLEPTIVNVVIVIGLTRWTDIARCTRGEFMRIKGQDYVLAAGALGIGHGRIILRHILPNALPPVLVTATFGIAGIVVIEAGLNWLGFGVQAPDPSWGNILRTAYDSLGVAPHMVYPPCIAIFLAVLACNLIGDALRNAIAPRLRGAT